MAPGGHCWRRHATSPHLGAVGRAAGGTTGALQGAGVRVYGAWARKTGKNREKG